MDSFKKMSPCEMIILSTAVAVVISDNMSAEDLNVLGNFIVAVGGLILTWAAQKQSLCSDTAKENFSENEIADTVKKLQDRLDKLERLSA